MRHLDLDMDIESIRMDLLKRQQEAMKPFQEELRKLDIIEGMVHRNGATPRPRKVPKKAKKRNGSKANGHVEPFAGMRQEDAVIKVLAKEPNLIGAEIAKRMVEGGFPFTTKNPKASIWPLLHQMAEDGRLRKSGEGGRGHELRYALP